MRSLKRWTTTSPCPGLDVEPGQKAVARLRDMTNITCARKTFCFRSSSRKVSWAQHR